MSMSQTVRRNSALDLSRFIAALIVFIGHFVWFDQYFSGWQENRVLGVFRSGNQSVLYFFALSGFVLSVSAKSINLRWLLARAFRLMPVYLLCFILPLVLVKIMAPEEYASYSQTGILLGLIASQSLFAQFYLAGANSPLWSLSVEIWLSIGLLVLHHISRKYVLFSLLIICEVLNYFYFQPIVNGLTFFLIGIILARINKLSIYSTLQSLFFKLTFLAVTFGYWFLIPILGVSVVPKRLLDLAGVCATLLFFGSLRLTHNADKIGYHLGARSYSLYAVHGPILRLHSEFFDLIWDNQLTIGQIWIYFISCLAMVLIATEIIFKCIELPAINYARNFRTAK
jgi:peptidoglycan/LPS O-acetylase OafA/YrhL